VTRTGRDPERGAELIEIALTLPLFLALVLAIVDCSRVVLAQSTLRTAVQIAARRALGPDRPQWDTMTALGAFPSPVSLDAYVEFKSVSGVSGWYFGRAGAQGIASGLFPAEVRALAYAYRAIESGIGNIQFPCSEAECASCFTMRGTPAILALTHPISANKDTELFGLECEYLLPILSGRLLGGWLPSRISIRSRAFLEANTVQDGQYSS
jgi:hypothetical protein